MAADTTLILGAGGMLGYPTLLEARRRNGDAVYGTYRTPAPALERLPGLHRIDLRYRDAVVELLEDLRPTLVVNCAGIVKGRVDDPYEAIVVNSVLPRLVARVIDAWDGRLVQVSTDCVFSGRRGRYRETDTPDPEDLYGRSKLLGEVTAEPHLSVRTSFIGFELASSRGLLAWFLAQRGTVRGWRQAVWSGLTADALAGLLLDLAERRDITGLLHIAGEAVDKYALLHALAALFDKGDVTIEPVHHPMVDRSLSSRYLRSLGFTVPPLNDMLRGLKAWGEEHAAEFAGEAPPA